MTRKTIIALALLFSVLGVASTRAALQGPSAPPKSPPSAAQASSAPVTENDSTGRLIYKHAYYLFLSGVANSCEDCYVPLLLTQEPLDEIALHISSESANCVWITTYERDSIWQMNGTVAVAPGSIKAPRRMIRFNGHSYRYQEITTREALRLLEKPSGAIPVSRPYLPDKSTPGSSLDNLISDFRTIFRVRERQWNKAPGAALILELIVLDDGTARYRVASGCIGPWVWDWKSKCPGSEISGTVFQYKLSTTQLSGLRTLLGQQEVKEISDSMNAAPIFDDFDIEIPREGRSQHIQVVAFMTSYFDLQHPPALIQVVCTAKRIEAAASNGPEPPDWCKNIPPLV